MKKHRQRARAWARVVPLAVAFIALCTSAEARRRRPPPPDEDLEAERTAARHYPVQPEVGPDVVPMPLPTDWRRLQMDLRLPRSGVVPFGYVQETRNLPMLWIPGASVFGAAYLTGVTYHAVDEGPDDTTRWLLVPIAGPWIAFSRLHDCSGDYCRRDEVRRNLVLSGVFQTLGAAALLLGLSVERTVLVRRDQVSLSVLPAQVASGASGIAAVGTF